MRMEVYSQSHNLSWSWAVIVPSTCLKKCGNEQKRARAESPSGFHLVLANKTAKAVSKKLKLKLKHSNSNKDLSRLLWTEAAVQGIPRKAGSASPKYTNLWPKPVLEALHQAIHQHRWESALKIFGLLRKQHWYKPRCQTCTKLLMMLGNCRKAPQATWLFQMLLSDGLRPTVDVFTALLHSYAMCALFDKAFSILDDMKSVYDCKPDAHTYSILLNCCIKHHRFDLVNHILADMSYHGIQCTTVTYNIVIDGYGKAKLFQMMEDLLFDMTETANCHPDVFTFNSFIWAHGSCGQIQNMERWYQEFQLMGISPDVRTFNILIASYGKVGMYHKMESVLDFMSKSFFSPSVVTFNTIIDIYGRAGIVDKADKFFLKMKHQGIKPNSFTFCSIVNAYCKAGKSYRVDSILRQIHNSDVVLDTPFFNCVINAYGRAGNIRKMRGVLLKMTERNCEPDHVTFATMLQAYNAHGMTDAADEVKSKMLAMKSCSDAYLRCYFILIPKSELYMDDPRLHDTELLVTLMLPTVFLKFF